MIDDRARQLLRQLLPDEWIVRQLPEDYGVDFEVEIVDQAVVTGNRFWLQLKGTESELEFREIGEAQPHRIDRPAPQRYVQFAASIKLLSYALQCGFPLLLVVADLPRGDAYWLPLRDEIKVNLASLAPNWEEQKSATVRIPVANSFRAEGEDGWAGLRHYALEPARFAAFCELHAIHHELRYMADLSYLEFNPDAIAPFEQELVCERLSSAERGLRQALAVGAAVPGGLLPPMVRADLEEALKLAVELPAQIRARTIDPVAGVVRLHRISSAIDSISTVITIHAQARGAWVLFERNVSKAPGTL